MSMRFVDGRTGEAIDLPDDEAYDTLIGMGLPPELVESFGFSPPPPRAATLMERVNDVLHDVAEAAKREQQATGRISYDTANVLARIGSFNQTALRAVLVAQVADPRTRGFVPDPYGQACGVNGCNCG